MTPEGRRQIMSSGISQDLTGRKATETVVRKSGAYCASTVKLSPPLPWTADPKAKPLSTSTEREALTGLIREEALGTGWIGTYDSKLVDVALRESEAFTSSILDSSTDCIDVVGLDGCLQFMNKSCRKLMEIYGYSVAAGQDWVELWADDVKAKAQDALVAARSGVTAHFANAGLTLQNTIGYWDISVSPIFGPTGEPERLLCISRDISALKTAQDELERARAAAEVAAKHDSLTGLLNRPGFREQLEQQLKQASSESQTAVLFLDLDEFKSVNDSLGHPAGDQLLRQAGGRLRACLRTTDQIARFGGDEFAIFQTSVTGPEPVESQARRIIDSLKEPYLLEGREVVVGVSIGIAVADLAGVEADDLLKRADIALYEAKHAGKGVYRFFVPGMDEAAEEHQRLRSELRDAVTRGEFRVYYQPVVEFETDRVTSFEALVRWEHPRRGLLSPAAFISLAETSGDIKEIGAWVLREACRVATTWPEVISVSVNLSPCQFRASGLVKDVSQALAASGLPAHRLLLEITESVLLQDDESVRDTLQKLQALNVQISIDDFGTGYSSLGYLLRFPADNIKIDRSFVAELSENPRASAILQALTVLSRELGVSLTAEGVETVTQLEQLKALGCHEGQGYLFSRPMPSEAVKVFLSGKREGR